MRGRLGLQLVIAAVALFSCAQPAFSQSTAALAQLPRPLSGTFGSWRSSSRWELGTFSPLGVDEALGGR